MDEDELMTTAFDVDLQALYAAADLAADPTALPPASPSDLPEKLPEHGIGPMEALRLMAPMALTPATSLRNPRSASRMATPTPWVTWVGAAWSAARSENLLNRTAAPEVVALQDRVIEWLAPVWGMRGGHMVPGATLANLTAIWAARDAAGASRIITSEAAHGSVAKISRILSMPMVTLPTDDRECLDLDAFVDFCRRDPAGMTRRVVVLTAGTHNCGAIDPLKTARRSVEKLGIRPAWWHVDASWAGPLRLSSRFGHLLDGIEQADSVTIAAHKLMFQPTESSVVLFKDPGKASDVLAFATPDQSDQSDQVGLLGSRRDRSLDMALMFMAYGKVGISRWMEQGITSLMLLAEALRARSDVEVFATPNTGVLLWRPTERSMDAVLDALGPVATGIGYVDGHRWLRNVGANPMFDWQSMLAEIDAALT